MSVNIGIIGNSGSGKSSFINAIRCLTIDDEGAAAAGLTETTDEPTPYAHPKNEQLKFWDLPGIGIPKFPKEEYVKKIGFHKFDFFLIVASSRFTENDKWLANEITQQEKKFFFVRTKIHNDIQNDKQSHPRTHNEEAVLTTIRDDIRKNLGNLYVEENVFLVDNYERNIYDFEELERRLIEEFPSIKREALVQSLNALSKWKEIPIKIGIIGDSGSGKSSFINTIRCLTADDEGAAAVGITEATTEPTSYTHPNNELLKFWDLPGVGTPKFPKEEYLKRIGFDNFDFFIIIASVRFTENDKWLAEQITQQEKKFFFVRTKIASDIQNDRYARPKTHNEETALANIREDIRTNLGNLYSDGNVFLIDNYEHEMYDFEKLEQRIIEEFPSMKRIALILSLNALSKWKEIPIKIGIIGNSGSGKSSFINAIRYLTADNEGAAAVGVTETTVEPTSYAHPNNEQLKFWDLPGVGTPKFPKEQYLKRIGFDKFDFFLIITNNRFTENDTWLAEKITQQKKKFFFVRTKIDNDMENDKESHPRTHNEETVLDRIRSDIRTNLGNLYVEENVFLIDSYEHEMYDFEELERRLVEDFPSFKRNALILSLNALSEWTIKKKVKILRGHMLMNFVASGAAALNPISGIPLHFDAGIVLEQGQLFFSQLGLDEESLKRTAEITSCDVDILKKIVNNSAKDLLSLEGITTLSKECSSLLAVEEEARSIPIIGMLVTGVISFGKIYVILDSILKKMEETALLVVRTAVEHSADKVLKMDSKNESE